MNVGVTVDLSAGLVRGNSAFVLKPIVMADGGDASLSLGGA